MVQQKCPHYESVRVNPETGKEEVLIGEGVGFERIRRITGLTY